MIDRFLPRRLQTKLSLLVTALLILLVSPIGAFFSDSAETLLREPIGAIREGINTVDGRGYLTFVNQAAREYLGRDFDRDLRGQPLLDVCPCPDLAQALAAGTKLLDREMPPARRPMIVNILPLERAGAGLVASFRPKDELDRQALS